MFANVYITAAGQAKLDDLRPLLPNVTFLLTMMCYVVFEYQPKDKASLDLEIDEPSNAPKSPVGGKLEL